MSKLHYSTVGLYEPDRTAIKTLMKNHGLASSAAAIRYALHETAKASEFRHAR